jgi:tetratricopeptide (TPR) repeat protein
MKYFFTTCWVLMSFQLILGQNYDAKNNFQKGEIELHLGDFKEAVKYYSHAIAQYGRYVEAYFSRGKAYLYLQENSKALADFQKATEISPQNPNAYFYIGAIYFQQMQHEKAIEFFDKTLQLDDKFAIAYNYRAESYKILGLTTASINDYDKAIRLEPQEAILYFGRGKCYVEREDYAHAISDFSKAIDLEPRRFEYYQYLADAYFLNGNYQASAQNIDVMMKMDKQAVDVNYRSMNVFCKENSKDFLGAINALNQVIELHEDSAELYVQRAGYFKELKAWNNAIEDYNKVVSYQQLAYYESIAQIYLEQKKYPEALQYFSKSIDSFPQNPNLWYQRGVLHLQLEHKKEAKVDLQQAAQLGFPKEQMDKKAYQYAKKGYKN